MFAFWTERATAIEQFWFLFYLFLSGMIAPLNVFPEGVKTVVMWTPFPYLIYFPASLLVGLPVNLGQGFGMMLAWSGRCSLTRIPGTFVGIDPNGPRTSVGASGFGSHESMWLNPPDSQKRMTEVGFAPVGVAADATPAPARPARLVCRNHRRDPARS